MNLTKLERYNPNMSDQEVPEDGVHTMQVTGITPKPLDLTGTEGELFWLTVIEGDSAGARVPLTVFSRNDKLSWKVKSSQNLLAGLKECSGNYNACDSVELLNAVVRAETKKSIGKDGRVWCNIVKFLDNQPSEESGKTQEEEITYEDIPF